MLSYTIGEIEVDAKVPSLQSLTSILDNGLKINHGAMKQLVRACIDAKVFDQLARQHPTCFHELGASILEDVGIGGEFEVLDEEDLDRVGDQALIDAYAAQQAKSEALFKDPSDNRRKLYALRFEAGPDKEERRIILRYPSGKEVDAALAGKSFQSYQALLKTLCVYGDVMDLESFSPGSYLSLTLFIVGAAGAAKVQRRGKS